MTQNIQLVEIQIIVLFSELLVYVYCSAWKRQKALVIKIKWKYMP